MKPSSRPRPGNPRFEPTKRCHAEFSTLSRRILVSAFGANSVLVLEPVIVEFSRDRRAAPRVAREPVSPRSRVRPPPPLQRGAVAASAGGPLNAGERRLGSRQRWMRIWCWHYGFRRSGTCRRRSATGPRRPCRWWTRPGSWWTQPRICRPCLCSSTIGSFGASWRLSR